MGAQVQTENVVFEKRCMAASDALRRQAKEQHEDAKATLLQVWLWWRQ